MYWLLLTELPLPLSDGEVPYAVISLLAAEHSHYALYFSYHRGNGNLAKT